ncbi:MAG: DNA polymerase III subunit alpha [SAR202 cluster bacterium]|nr:DNA polymerase III subunit alpha [SAR202 cluster bacterium]|tara:strand:+ start:260 stop:3811 length:3552 start_codon:yes stop_codon:yes gene_type:complete
MFTHLHVHTEYSLLDGMCRIPELIDAAKAQGMTALGMTDHGNLYGVVEFYEYARKAGIKPIIGCEVYVAPFGRSSRKPSDKQPYHLTLLAKNNVGYENLVQLVSKGHLEGFYYKPRIDRELMEQHSEGLIALSGCLAAEVPRLITAGQLGEARESISWYKETFNDYYLELQSHEALPELTTLNSTLVTWSEEMNLPLVATNDLHYVNATDAEYHDMLLCIQTNANVNDTNRMRLDDPGYYLKTEEEMQGLFPNNPEAIENTQRIADMCELNLEFDRLLLPQIDIPNGKDSKQYLEELCWEGFAQRFNSPTEDERERLRYELDVINKMTFADYFLVVWDIVKYAREQNILLGIRGSAAASLVLYCLGITSINPLDHTLVFERFLNLERKELPDIDLDFQDDQREKVIEYVTRKYGQDRVAQIITFGTLGARGALRDTGRALGIPISDVDQLTRMIPAGPQTPPLKQLIEQVPQIEQLYQNEPQFRNLLTIADHLEGIARHVSTHAAGIVISKDPLIKHVPLQRPARSTEQKNETVMTQWDMNGIAKAGLLKMDFLGLINLTILSQARELISENLGIELDLETIPFDNEPAFSLLSSADTTGVFQLEGSGMRRYIQQVQPASLKELAAMIALYRPGPMEHIPAYADAKMGRNPIKYPHDDLKPILQETYGIIVYQDQVLHIVRQFAGYSLGEADTVRKAMGKKIASIMTEEKEKFVSGALERGYDNRTANDIFDLIEPFAGYAFNKSHSVSYAVIAYQTAYLKANYPIEFFTATLNSFLGQTERTGIIVEDGRKRGIAVNPPDVNRSNVMFTIETREENGTGEIRTGLAGLKNVGAQAIQTLVNERIENGSFTNIEDFCKRAGPQAMNRRVLESLIKSGSLDSLNIPRSSLLKSMDQLISLAQSEQKLQTSSQSTMFEMMGDSAHVVLPKLDLANQELTTQIEKANWERELTGTIFTADPRQRIFQSIERPPGITEYSDITSDMSGSKVAIRGQVISNRKFRTRQGQEAISVNMQDLIGEIEVVAWPDLYLNTQELWTDGMFLEIHGRVRSRNDDISLVADRVEELNLNVESNTSILQSEANEIIEHKDEPTFVRKEQPDAATNAVRSQRFTVIFHETNDVNRDSELLDGLWSVLESHKGDASVRLIIVDHDGERTNLVTPQTITWSSELESEIHSLAGLDVLRG